MDAIATMVGYAVLVAGGVGLACVAGVLGWAFFPARFEWARDLPSHLATPSGPLKLTALVGVGSRHRARWFFGFMLLKPGEAPAAKVLARKPKWRPKAPSTT